jgi:dTDP-4-amino-4,6-dideoxygalactose transaminase
LRDWAQGHGVATPFVPLHCEQPYHMYYLLLPSFEVRQAFIASLREKGIYSVFHYLPLHLSQMGSSFGGHPGDCPVTESTSDRLARLPFYTNLTETEQCRVIEAVQAFRF